MHNNTVFEPQVVRVVAELAGIKEVLARKLLTQVAVHYGAKVHPNGSVSCKDRATFARMWDHVAQELRELRKVS